MLTLPLPSMAHVKTRFRQLKHDLAWLVNHLLRTCYTFPDNDDTEPLSSSPHTLDLDSFLAAVTAILSEKSYVILFGSQNISKSPFCLKGTDSKLFYSVPLEHYLMVTQAS